MNKKEKELLCYFLCAFLAGYLVCMYFPLHDIMEGHRGGSHHISAADRYHIPGMGDDRRQHYCNEDDIIEYNSRGRREVCHTPEDFCYNIPSRPDLHGTMQTYPQWTSITDEHHGGDAADRRAALDSICGKHFPPATGRGMGGMGGMGGK